MSRRVFYAKGNYQKREVLTLAMKVTGHKPRSLFDRYHLVSPADLQRVARKLTDMFWAQSTK
ncbi:MAG TPA: hypothetical protein VNP04_06440 [Alphaproteobacteria bacterium]|nr:hypothetical protein [Alphaproteobacteria bacterium]